MVAAWSGERGAGAAVNERLKHRAFRFIQNAAALQPVELVRREARGVDTAEIKRDLADCLRCVDMQSAVRIIFQNLRNLMNRLNRSKLAVYGTDSTEYRILPQQRFQMREVNFAVRLNVHKVDFPALFLQKGQCATDGAVF